MEDAVRIYCLPVYRAMLSIFPHLCKRCNTQYGIVFTWHSRLKTAEGIATKMGKKTMLLDVIGFRILNPWVSVLYQLVPILKKEFEQYGIVIHTVSYRERGRVIYLYCSFDKVPIEIQLWPCIMYHCFEYEHGRVYKPVEDLTPAQIEKSTQLREKEHALQDIIEQNVL